MSEIKLFGYARVSTQEQHLDRQLDLLKEYGVKPDDVYTDKISGAKLQRPALEELQRALRSGDIVIVESLSRLSRSSKDLLNLLQDWQDRGVGFVSVKERLDLTTPAGKMMLTVMAALSQFERDVTHDRVMEGLAAARARGKYGGRPKTDPSKVTKALKLYDAGSLSVGEICEATGVSQSVLYRAIQARQK